MEVKPSWKSMEWWITVATSAITFATGIGVITMTEAASLNEAVKSTSGGVTLILTGAGIVWKFIESRRSVKVEVAKANAEIAKAQPQEAPKLMQRQI